jgi:ribosome-binding factor A
MIRTALRCSRYKQTQKLNEQLLRSELDAIDEVVRDSRVSAISEDAAHTLIKQKTTEKARRMMGIGRDGTVNHDKVRRYSPSVSSMPSSPEDGAELFPSVSSEPHVVDRLQQFESMKGRPRFQDLTHPEARRVQELFERKKMLARKVQWLKNNQIVDPVKTVNKEMRQKEKESRNDNKTPQVYSKDPVVENKIRKLEFSMERDTAISRMRTEMRKQKLENSAVMKKSSPSIGSVITDPLKRHLTRRKVRVALLMQQYIEELLSCNSAQIIVDHLGGAAISVDRVVAPSTRGVHDVYVRISSDHDRKWVQKQLDILTPKLRSQLAVRVNYGYTPELKFHILDDVDKFNKSRLMKLADEAKREVDTKLHHHFMKEMNWK